MKTTRRNALKAGIAAMIGLFTLPEPYKMPQINVNQYDKYHKYADGRHDIGFYGYAEQGFAVLDNRRVLMGSLG